VRCDWTQWVQETTPSAAFVTQQHAVAVSLCPEVVKEVVACAAVFQRQLKPLVPAANWSQLLPLTPAQTEFVKGEGVASSAQTPLSSSSMHHHLPTEHRRQCNREQAQRRRSRSRSPHRHRSHHRRLPESRDSNTYYRRRSPGNPRGGDEESKLVTVKWIHPSVSDHQMLESLRDNGLFIPAGTQVLSM